MERRFLILGREPALWIAVLQSMLAIIVGFNWDGLNAEQAALWISATNAILGVFMAILTRPWSVPAFTTGITVIATLLAAYGLDLGQEMVGSINALLVAGLILIARGEISPAPYAHQTGVLGNKVTTEPNSYRRDS